MKKIPEPKKPTGNIDYRKRVALKNGSHEVLFYGLDRYDYSQLVCNVIGPDTYDVVDKFDHSAGQGRGPGRPVELETQQHFFNRRIM